MNGVIQAVQEPETLLTSNIASLPVSVVDLRPRSAINCNGWMNHNEGSALFSIIEGGVYEVTFNANVTSAEEGVVGLALFADGTEIIGTEVKTPVATAGEFSNGVTVEIEGNIFQIIEFMHVKPGKGAAFVRAKLKNIKNGEESICQHHITIL